ncbi:MFS transporter [Winkia neuii]|uniref:MFS transporter n=1 Tax=Winkia neuii TaxID=33007 RepID=A0A2I1IL56_9ACTO|nr:MFS transporter [Winkia neuii]PKY71847.1 MFS transporter [Winkia neuii]
MSVYKQLFSIPGAARFSLAGALARFPMAMTNLAVIMMITSMYKDYALAGRLSAVAAVSFALMVPQLSRLVDIYGQAKIMFPSVLLSACSFTGLAITAQVGGPRPLLYLLTIVGAGFSGSIGALVRARWAYVLKEPGKLQSAFALEATFDEVIFIVGPVLATVLATEIHGTAGIFATAIISVVGAFLLLPQRDTEPVPSGRKPAPTTPSKPLLKNRTLLMLMVVYIAMGAIFGGLDVSCVAFASESGWPSGAGVILAAMSIGSLIAGLIYGARSWKPSILKLYLLGVAFLGIGCSILQFAPSVVWFIILVFITGSAFAPTATNVMTMVSQAVPSSRLTESMAWMVTASNVGASIGSAVGGQAIQNSGAHGGLFTVAVSGWAMVILALLTAPYLRKTRNNALRVL